MAGYSEDQLAEFQEAFQLFDSRGDGKIHVAQIGDALRALGQNPTESDVKKCTLHLKPDERISFEVFLPIYQDCDSSPVSIDQRIVGHVEAVTKLREIFSSIQNLACPGEQTCPSCTTVGDSVRLVQERVRELSEAVITAQAPPAAADAAAQTADADHADTLRAEIIQSQQKHDEEKQKLTGLVKDLETSLEQMKAEYDKCEEYWSGKLEEERDMFAEEQRLGDERLAELVAKIGEYERQFSAAPALPTIDERHSLEAQFTDLEEEFARYRRDSERELGARADYVA